MTRAFKQDISSRSPERYTLDYTIILGARSVVKVTCAIVARVFGSDRLAGTVALKPWGLLLPAVAFTSCDMPVEVVHSPTRLPGVLMEDTLGPGACERADWGPINAMKAVQMDKRIGSALGLISLTNRLLPTAEILQPGKTRFIEI